MPKCRNCGGRITRFDKDICPICGEKNPLAGVSSETVEITSNLDLNDVELKNFKPSTRFKTFILFILIGWTGAPMFYLRYIRIGLIWLFINASIFIASFLPLLLLTNLGLLFSLLIAISIIYIINIIMGIIAYFKHNLKDGRGEFLR